MHLPRTRRAPARAAPHHALCRISATPIATCQVREFQMLRTLRHPNIIRLYGAYETPRKRAHPDAVGPCAPCCCCLICHLRSCAVYLVTELAGGGELMKRLPESTRVYSEEMVRTCAPRAANEIRSLPEPEPYSERNPSRFLSRGLDELLLFDRCLGPRRYVMTLLEAVMYMHEKNCVHRDLKPENVLLSDMTENAQASSGHLL